ncbi:hypothetical protein ACFOW1_09625 [Parasediminibacterium paludis]|uniref:Uncharacterized protein n=1 Tax=Parasediminibacterium paludis TaxID=908966 RepID=A0ABV8PZA4_9BACT
MPKVQLEIYVLQRHRIAKKVLTHLKQKFPGIKLHKWYRADKWDNVDRWTATIEVEEQKNRPSYIMKMVQDEVDQLIPQNDYIFCDSDDRKLPVLLFGIVPVLAVDVYDYTRTLYYLNPFKHA